MLRFEAFGCLSTSSSSCPWGYFTISIRSRERGGVEKPSSPNPYFNAKISGTLARAVMSLGLLAGCCAATSGKRTDSTLALDRRVSG